MRSLQYCRNPLLTMAEPHFDAVFQVEMLGQVLRRIDGAILSACATECEHHRRETARYLVLEENTVWKIRFSATI